MSNKKEYIEREAVLNEQIEICHWDGLHDSYDDFVAVKDILAIPTADVEVVRYGKWIEGKRIGLNVLQYTCSECGLWADAKFPYCHCGAKMDGRDEE